MKAILILQLGTLFADSIPTLTLALKSTKAQKKRTTGGKKVLSRHYDLPFYDASIVAAPSS